MDLKKTINELDESQTRVEKHAFDVINSSDTSLNLVKEGITNIKEIVDNIGELNELIKTSTENIKNLEEFSDTIQEFATAVGKIAGRTNTPALKLQEQVKPDVDLPLLPRKSEDLPLSQPNPQRILQTQSST
mgnify:CR=1 FL=1